MNTQEMVLKKLMYISKTCLELNKTVEDYKVEWDATRYMVFGKMYAMVGSNNVGRPIITLKHPTSDVDIIQSMYEDIIPGYYMNKNHWISIYLDKNSISDEFLKELIIKAYTLIVQGLPKKLKDILTNK